MTDIKTTKADTTDGQLIADKISSAVDIFDQIDTGELAKYLDKEVTGSWAYEFKLDPSKPAVHGLSSAGANEASRFIAHKSGGQIVIRTMTLESVIEEPDCFKATVKAGSYIVGFAGGKPIELLLDTSIGFAKQMKKGSRKDGSTWDIPHAEVIAVTKAERNAKAHLIPERIKAEIIRIALGKGKVAPTDPDSAGEKETNGNGFITEGEYADMFAMLKDHNVVPNHLLNHCKKHYQYTSLKNIKKDKFKEILAWIEAGGKAE
jgi:hypothetical protein